VAGAEGMGGGFGESRPGWFVFKAKRERIVVDIV